MKMTKKFHKIPNYITFFPTRLFYSFLLKKMRRFKTIYRAQFPVKLYPNSLPLVSQLV